MQELANRFACLFNPLDELKTFQELTDALRKPEITLPEASVQAVRRAEPDAETLLSQLSITVPLEIDGYRLGVAAIEGINRVSQGTGRVELTL